MSLYLATNYRKPQHIESVMAVNGTSRAMQGSDCMRLRAQDDRSWSADGEPETANSYFTAHRLEAQKCRIAVFIALAV